MVAWTKPIAIACSLPALVRTFQVSPSKAQGNRSSFRNLDLIMLDESDVESRGSHCLDGTAPGYYHEKGSEDGKWLLWFQGGGMCISAEDCASKVPLHSASGDLTALPLMETEDFNSYNRVYMRNCDFGLFSGDVADPVDYQGTKLYFQGKRIVDHVLATLQSTTTFGSATEVLITGGSGGGQTSYVIADYLASIMPASVQKFGSAPINGWHAPGSFDEMKAVYTLANMGTAASTACKNAFSPDEQYNCIIPASSYTYSETPIFITQLLDYTYQTNDTLVELIDTPYKNCLGETASGCTQEDVGALQDHLDSFTAQVQSSKQWQDNGGFLSTCTEHTFYNYEDTFAQYKNNGVSAGDAIGAWWASLTDASKPANFYLPCTLGSPDNIQCEASCAA